MAKVGRKSKDKTLTEGFNKKKKGAPSDRELRQAVLAKKRAEAEHERTMKAAKAVAGIEEEFGDMSDDEKSAYQMLQDMRYVYRKVNGRKKLLDLIKTDDKQFVAMVKELIKIEGALMTAKVKSKDDGNNGNVFFVIKGLEDNSKSNDKQIVFTEAGAVDVGQIRGALYGNLDQKQEKKEIPQGKMAGEPEFHG